MIRVLDCTLRDGGYLNDWDFGIDTVRYVVQRHIMSGADCIEVGFLDDRRSFDINRTIQPDIECYDKQLAGIDKKNTLLFAMIDYGTCSIEHISLRQTNTVIDGIRLIFKKPNKEKAVAFAHQIMERGYLVTLQMVSITAYGDRDVLDFCDEANDLKPYAVGIVDTYGLLHQEQLMHYFELLNHNMNRSIIIGYHAHNNFQLAYSNSLRFLESRVDRDVMVDGTALGMGKNAGNAPLELIMMHMNDNYNKHYEIDQVLETIDACILPIYAKVEWGYKLRFFLSASNACHPNYVDYLQSKKSLPIGTINSILQMIHQEKKLDYDKALIEQLYISTQTNACDIFYNDAELAQLIKGQKILLLGPGISLVKQRDKINHLIETEAPIVISVNCIPDCYQMQYVFLSNSKRYSMLHSRLQDEAAGHTIVTSNVGTITRPSYVLDMARYWEGDSLCGDNALALLLNIMKQDQPQVLYLAGFDGFSSNNDENFYDKHLALADDFFRLQNVNAALKERIISARKTVNIVFVTTSRYE